MTAPYAKRHQVPHELGSIRRFAENVFALPRINMAVVRADGLDESLDFRQYPARSEQILYRRRRAAAWNTYPHEDAGLPDSDH